MQPRLEVRQAFAGNERFRVSHKIGEGAFGAVYEAFDEQRKTRCALKLLQHVEAAAIYRFKTEFRSLADVVHPNLVGLQELVSAGDRWFFTMDLVEGGVDFLSYVTAKARVADPADFTMEAPINDDPPMSVRSMRTIIPTSTPANIERLREALSQLARGASAVHSAGKLHCDLKPSNVLVTQDGRVVLLDFGLITELAPRVADDKGNRGVIGTPAYMSPEQARGAVLTPASDWYSVGVMLYEALTGSPPFAGGTLETMLGKQMRDPPAPRSLIPDVPDDLDSLAMDLLKRDPHARPTREEIVSRLGLTSGRTSTRPPTPSIAPFVGRGTHLESLREAFAATKWGEAASAFVRGASGAGKSALVRRFLDEVELSGGAVVLEGRCYEREVVPFKALDSLIDSLTQYLLHQSPDVVAELCPPDVGVLTRLFPVLGRIEGLAAADEEASPDKQELRRRASQTLRELFHRIAARTCLVLSVDDLQWGDADSAAIFLDILRPPSPPLLLIGCYRTEDGEKSPLVTALRAPRALREEILTSEIVVDPLSEEESMDLARALLPGHGDADAVAVARESGGSPLFVMELARHVELAEPGQQLHSLVRLDDALFDRVEKLTSPARKLLEVIAVAGRPLSAGLAIEVAELEAEGWLALGALRAARLVRTTTNGAREVVETFHDRIRETVASRLATKSRAEVHHRIALLLESASRVDPEALYAHFLAAGELGDAGVYAARAARRAAEALAFDHAAALYRFAIEHGDARERRALRVELGDALANAGRGEEAGGTYLQAADEASGHEAIELRRRAADSLLLSGRIPEGVATVRGVLTAVGVRWPVSAFGAILSILYRRLLLKIRGIDFRERRADSVTPRDLARLDACWSVARGLAMFDPLRGADFQTRGLLLALDVGEPNRISRALAMAASFMVTEGASGKRWGEEMLHRSEEIAARTGDPHANGFAKLVVGSTACMAGNWRRARSGCEQAAKLLRDRCAGVPTEIATAELYIVTTSFYLGDIPTFLDKAPRVLEEALGRKDLYTSTVIRTGHPNARWLVLDNPEHANAEVEEAMSAWSDERFLLPHYFAALSRSQTDLYTGDSARAYERVLGVWGPMRRSLMLQIQPLRIELLYLRGRAALAAAMKSGNRRHLRDAASTAERLANERAGWSTGMAHLLHGGVATAEGDFARARASFKTSAKAFGECEMELFASVALRRAAECAGEDTKTQDSWMTEKRIKNPERMSAMLAPFSAPAPSPRALPPASA